MATAIWAKSADGNVTSPAHVTYDEFLRQTEGEFAEWEGGKIRRRDSLVSYTHTEIGAFLVTLLRTFTEDSGTGRVIYAPFQMRLQAVNRGREPDVAVVLTRNVVRILPNYLDGPADLAIEIVSPESEERDRQIKFAEYETCGVTEYWIVDPATRTAEFYVRDSLTGKYAARMHDANGNYESAVLSGFWLTVAWLWQTPLPTLRTVTAAWAAGKP